MSSLPGPIVICKPLPAGEAGQDEHFLYAGSIASVVPLARTDVPTYEAIDDGDPPGRYVLPIQQGWLVEFRRMFAGIERWVAYASEGAIYLDSGAWVRNVSAGEVVVKARLFGCFVRVHVAGPGLPDEVFWTRFSLLRWVFFDPVCEKEECEPLCALFTVLSTAEGHRRRVEFWMKGYGHVSEALTVVLSPGCR